MSEDAALNEVFEFLVQIEGYSRKIGETIRQAIDEVVAGPTTNRWSVGELEKVEKTYIGTRVEILLRRALDLGNGTTLDYLVRGHEVDAKFSLTRAGWMIPREAVGEICLLISADDDRLRFSCGLVRVTPDILTQGSNQDLKRSISASGRTKIKWIVETGTLPKNFLMHEISTEQRISIFEEQPGTARVERLFRTVRNKAIPASIVVILAIDPQRVAKEAVSEAAKRASLPILDGTVERDVERADSVGVALQPGYFMCIDESS